MAITFALVEATPYRLRYLATQDGVISSPPVAADGFNTIPNDGGASPDLRTDAVDGVSGVGVQGPSPARNILRARLDGYGVVGPGALTQAQARALLNSHLPEVNLGPGNRLTVRAILRVQGRTSAGANTNNYFWAVDANVDAQGDPVIEVRSAVGVAGTAYVDMIVRHTRDL